jgi:4a-hydroxytetrahydrobiopterin dehydratase
MMQQSDIEIALNELKGWSFVNDNLVRTFSFNDFRDAFAFMTRVAFLAEEHQHHPRFDNVYNTVTLSLNTHDAGNKVTEKDLALARSIQAL